jgi:hypothetical protein
MFSPSYLEVVILDRSLSRVLFVSFDESESEWYTKLGYFHFVRLCTLKLSSECSEQNVRQATLKYLIRT